MSKLLGLIAGSLRLISSVLYTRLSGFGVSQLRWLGLGCVGRDYTHLIPDVCSCHVLRIFAVALCKIGVVCCLSAPAHQPFSANSLDLSAPEEAYSRNVRVSATLKFGYEGVFNISLGIFTEKCLNGGLLRNY